MAEEKKKEAVEETLVVASLPQQPSRNIIDETGKEYSLMTAEEALTEILLNTRIIKKSIA